MSPSRRHLVVMAAGTGGHVIPGLAVAQEMQARGWTVSWLGTETGMEQRLVPPSGIPMDTLAFSGLRGKGLWHTLTGGLRLLRAFWDCRRILRARGADAVLGMGGYVCFPGGMMAAWLGKPLVLVNADAALLLSNKALMPVADAVAFGFDGDVPAKTAKAWVSGNPVRADIEAIEAPERRLAGRTGPLRILVVGGSLGAKVLNDTLPEAMALLAPAERPIVSHQTGVKNAQAVRQAYLDRGLPLKPGADGMPSDSGLALDATDGGEGAVEVLPFIDNMASRLAQADLIICRAGAITVSEICAAGVASVLVPLIVSTTSHQRDNAQAMAERQAAIHLPQKELTPQSLAALIRSLDRERLLSLATSARRLARPAAAQSVADRIEQLAFPNQKEGVRP